MPSTNIIDFFSISSTRKSYVSSFLVFSALSYLCGLATSQPLLLLAPALAVTVWMLGYVFHSISHFKYHRFLRRSLLSLLAVQGIFCVIEPAYSFSLLFAATETVLRTCVLSSVPGLAVLAAVIFGFLRVGYMTFIGASGYKIYTRQQQGQDFSEILQIVLISIILLVVIGALEPLIVGGGC